MAIVGEAHVVVRAITVGFQRDVEKSLKDINGSVKNIGENIGKDFNKSVSKGMGSGGSGPFKSVSKEAEQARLSFNKLTKAGYFLAPAISGAVGAVGDLVFGLFAVGSAVGAAVPALVVLPGILTAIAQAGAVAKLAFMGVGKAIGALTKQQAGGGVGAASQAKAIADARKALARAYQDAADKMYDADLKVARAQADLTAAYAKGREELQQLGFSAEEASLSQDKAALQLERAREALRRVQDLPPNSRARRDAELAFKEADLNYRQAKDKVNDLAKEQAYAAQTGVEGTQVVIDAQQALNDARTDQARTERDNAQRIADAQDNLADALKRTSAAGASAASALAGLPKSAQDFAKYIASIKPEFDKLRAAAADGLFPKLTTSVQTLVENLFPRLVPIIGDTAGAIGDLSIKFADMLTTTENMDRIDRIFGDTNIKVIEDLGGAAVNLGEAFLIILDAARPLIEKFSEWVKLTTDGWLITLKAKDATGELTDIFNTAGEDAATIGGVIGTTGSAFFELGKSAKGAGLKIIKAFGGAMEKLKEFATVAGNDGMFSEGARGASTLETKFDKIADNFITIGKFAGEMAKALFDVSGNPGIKTFFESIMGLPGTFADVADKVNSVMGEKFGDFVNELGILIANFTETGGMSIFFDILTQALKVVNILFSNPVIASAFGLLGAVKGISLAFGAIGTASTFTKNLLIGQLDAIKVGAGNVATGLGMVKQGFTDARGVGSAALSPALTNVAALIKGTFTGDLKTVTATFGVLNDKFIALGGAATIGLGPFLLIVAAIAAVAFVLYKAYESSETLRTAVSNLVSAVGGALGDAMATINDAIKEVMPSFNGVSDVFKKIGDYLGTYVVPFFQIALVNAINVVAGIISGFIKIVGGIITAFSDPIKGIKLILSGFIDFFKAFFLTPLTSLLKAADIFGLLPDGFKKAINKMIRMWNDFELELKIPSNAASKLLGIDGKGFTISTPNVPLLAKGGIVPATSGGMLSIIGEAGRPERVEPLDPNGLSARDRAIINEFILASGGKSGGTEQTFNIFPSPGMDESELSNLVSRKVAWNMRIGA